MSRVIHLLKNEEFVESRCQGPVFAMLEWIHVVLCLIHLLEPPSTGIECSGSGKIFMHLGSLPFLMLMSRK